MDKHAHTRYGVYEAARVSWTWEVRYMAGRVYCRCHSEQDAQRIAAALNVAAKEGVCLS